MKKLFSTIKIFLAVAVFSINTIAIYPLPPQVKTNTAYAKSGSAKLPSYFSGLEDVDKELDALHKEAEEIKKSQDGSYMNQGHLASLSERISDLNMRRNEIVTKGVAEDAKRAPAIIYDLQSGTKNIRDLTPEERGILDRASSPFNTAGAGQSDILPANEIEKRLSEVGYDPILDPASNERGVVGSAQRLQQSLIEASMTGEVKSTADLDKETKEMGNKKRDKAAIAYVEFHKKDYQKKVNDAKARFVAGKISESEFKRIQRSAFNRFIGLLGGEDGKTYFNATGTSREALESEMSGFGASALESGLGIAKEKKKQEKEKKDQETLQRFGDAQTEAMERMEELQEQYETGKIGEKEFDKKVKEAEKDFDKALDGIGKSDIEAAGLDVDNMVEQIGGYGESVKDNAEYWINRRAEREKAEKESEEAKEEAEREGKNDLENLFGVDLFDDADAKDAKRDKEEKEKQEREERERAERENKEREAQRDRDESEAKSDLETLLDVDLFDDDGEKDKEKEEKEKEEREKAEREKAERERAERDKAEREKKEREKAEREKAEREKAERERAEREKAEREKKEREKAERERKAQEKAERERLAAEKKEREKAEREKKEREKAERQRLERERAEREKAEKQRLEREKKEKEKKEREAKEKAEKEKKEQEAARRAAQGGDAPTPGCTDDEVELMSETLFSNADNVSSKPSTGRVDSRSAQKAIAPKEKAPVVEGDGHYH